jgi:RNase P/RNase MRP subunit p30
MHILNTPNLEEARKQIQKITKENKNPKEKIALLSQDDEFNRKALEIKKLNALIINETLYTKDYSKQRNSGLNEVLCEIAKKNNIAIGIQLSEIIKKPTIDQARALARLKQNLDLTKRTNTKMFIANTEIQDRKSLIAILLSLKASTKQAQEIVNFTFS